MRILAGIGRKWLKIAHVIGTVQMVIALTLVYWLMLAPMALALRFAKDPLALRRPPRPQWGTRSSSPSVLDSMKNQY